MADICHIICSCFRAHPSSPDEPDEHTHLLPPTEEFQSVRIYAVDPHELRERMGTIVRAKEGKMVNVNAQLPFNIYNNPFLAQFPHDTSRRCLSEIQNDLRDATKSNTSSETTPTANNTSAPAYPLSRDLSPSHTSPSSSSLHPGDASYLPPDTMTTEQPRPLFSMRIVPTATGLSIGPSKLTRGRSATCRRLSLSRSDDPRVDVQTDGRSSTTPRQHDLVDHFNSAMPNTSQTKDDVTPGHQSGKVGEQPQELSFVADFRIQDVGKISQSWSD
ncbi:hypothetical protein CERSUDRAFT_96387 [Gelatoporia subvermispora B]|uniref:Uncharacterized protein n=1 Tax=Ceriporiopsis subvermispora (strain B) TaxID=914234 RepID=M2PGU2_CERS8|nr:hypothetical protein CERSUDRAFT_96387 [Gelatoporia subvermispora B]